LILFSIRSKKTPPRFMRRQSVAWILICCLSLALLPPARAAISVVDDANHTITLTAPARRIISLAPHATELIYAVGGGAYLIGASEYSDYPPQAKRLVSIGNVTALDLERIAALKPDLIVAWGSGNSAAQIAKLRTLGIPVFESEPRDFATIASSLERLSKLTATEATGQAAAQSFRARLEQMREKYRQRPTVRVFYQIWRTPLMTLNDAHLVSAAIRLCGGENIFGQLTQLAPTVNTEAVLKANPEVIIAASGAKDDAFADWRRFPGMLAVARGNLFRLDGDLINRATPRILDGTEALCKQLDIARSRR
jgi:iron complex transport system substrate-binding protein